MLYLGLLASDTGNAIDNENKARIQLKDGQNQERAKDPNKPHNE